MFSNSGCIVWQIDSSNGTCHIDSRDNKIKDDLQNAQNAPEHIYQERVNRVSSGMPEEVLGFHDHSYPTDTPCMD